MTNFVVNKYDITRKVLFLLKDSNPTDSELSISLFKWWSNIRTDGGLKLTDSGNSAFKDAELDHFDYPFKVWSGTLLLKLDRYMPCPYYLVQGRINKSYARIYDSRVAMLIGLHGTIIDYVNSLDVKRTELSISSKL